MPRAVRAGCATGNADRTGGIGKTRLALAVSEQVGDVVEDDVEFVSLASIADYRLVVPTIARTLGVLEQADRPILARLIDYLRERQTLLVLDNFEHVIPAADAVAELLRECPRLSILATSREPLHLSSEREYAVAPLPLPAAVHQGRSTRSPGTTLFGSLSSVQRLCPPVSS